MRVDEWEFADAAHPVYERAPQETRWPAALPRMIPDEYMDIEGQTVEPLHMSMAGYPSIDLYKGPGGATIQKAILRTAQDMRDVDLTEIERIAEEWLKHLRTMSLGPYSLHTLREMGHPPEAPQGNSPGGGQAGNPPQLPPTGAGSGLHQPAIRRFVQVLAQDAVAVVRRPEPAVAELHPAGVVAGPRHLQDAGPRPLGDGG